MTMEGKLDDCAVAALKNSEAAAKAVERAAKPFIMIVTGK